MTEELKKTRLGSRKIIVIIISLFVLAGLGYFSWRHFNHKQSSSVALSFSTQQSQSNSKALANARIALTKNPNDTNAIAIVASLTPNKTESKQLYAKLLTIYQNNMKNSTATPTTYWAEANLAVKAGEKTQAKTYYQDVINAAASTSNSYDKSLAQQAQSALKELQ